MIEAALIGADIATMPANVYQSLLKHPLTDIGLARFLEDWRKAEPALEARRRFGTAVYGRASGDRVHDSSIR